MTRKDEKITLGIILGIMLLALVGSIIACINMGFTEYIERVTHIMKDIRIIC